MNKYTGNIYDNDTQRTVWMVRGVSALILSLCTLIMYGVMFL